VVKSCLVSSIDSRGVKHSVEVTADTLFEADALGLAALKRNGWTDAMGIATRLTVEIREPVVSHQVSLPQIQGWLQGATSSPNERLREDRLRELLRDLGNAVLVKSHQT